MVAVAEVCAWLSIAGGIAFLLAGGIGVLRLPDIYTRMHAAGMTDTLGAGLILLGFAFEAGLSEVTIKLGLIFAFLLFTSPASSHAVANAALHSGLKPILHAPRKGGSQ